MIMEVTRTFHPVGQGAFYTERFYTGNGAFTIVYDCGSETLKKGKTLETRIRSTFPEGTEIDVLFISHFHDDHINGLGTLKDHCKIKRVVLPYLGKEEKVFLKAQYYLNHSSSSGFTYTEFESFLDNPARFLGRDNEVAVIEILPIDSEGEQEPPRSHPEEAVDITEIRGEWSNGQRQREWHQGGPAFNSGTVFKFPRSYEWFFIPFNYNQDHYSKAFKDAIEEEGLSLGEIDTIEKIMQHKDKIIKAYESSVSRDPESTNGDLNKSSMMLYSGPTSEDRFHFSSFFCHRFFCLSHCRSCYHPSMYPHSGCLYTGDIRLKGNAIVKDVSNRLENFRDAIGTLQIPHHGSIRNFNKSVLELGNIYCAIFSFGSNNHYGHPSGLVISEVVEEDVIPCLVTENPRSIVVQCISIR